MKSLKVYTVILYDLVIALFQLGCRVIRQMMLPTRRRPGNLLSSLFLLFTGVAENLINFGESFERVPCTFREKLFGRAGLGKVWAFSQKYIRQGMLIATWALFILSSLEWTEPRLPSNEPVAALQEMAAPERSECRQTGTAVIDRSCTQLGMVALQGGYVPFSGWPATFSTAFYGHRWLLLCILRI